MECVALIFDCVTHALISTGTGAIGDAGGVEAVLKVMTSFEEEYQVQVAGCRALANLTADTPENIKRAVAAGAVQNVIGALKANPADGQLQWRAIQLLGKLDAEVCVVYNHVHNRVELFLSWCTRHHSPGPALAQKLMAKLILVVCCR